jgi:hypothetical protein
MARGSIVKNSGASPTLAAARVVELPNEMPALPNNPQPARVVHLFPKQDGWILMSIDKGEQGTHFSDLGRALDAATAADAQVHVVVHERGAA